MDSALHTSHMDPGEAPQTGVVLESERLVLRRWRTTDAATHRRLWLERDPRVPSRRRVDSDGRPTVSELEDWARHYDAEPAPGLLIVEHKGSAAVLGYCGLIPNSRGRRDEPELAFEFLRAFWNQGFATEAARVVLDRARELGYRHLASTVRDWNSASLRVLDKLGFGDTGETEEDEVHGDSLLLRTVL